MEDNDQKNTNSLQTTASGSTARGKVLQPSESFIAEMKAVPAQQPAGYAGNMQPTASQGPEQSSAAAQPAIRVSSIYPDPTSTQSTSSSASVSEAEPAAIEQREIKQQPKVLAIRVVAGIIVLLGIFNAYNWLLQLRGGYVSWINIVEISATIALAIGILMLKEAARAAYVLLSGIILALTCIGLFALYTSLSRISPQPLTKSQLQNSIRAAESNTALPPKARQEDIQQLQAQINDLSGTPDEQKVMQYISSGLFIITAVGPLVFFTRPSIKEVFH